jgi:hypothetical protein
MTSSFSRGLLCGRVKIFRSSSATWENTLSGGRIVGSVQDDWVEERGGIDFGRLGAI